MAARIREFGEQLVSGAPEAARASALTALITAIGKAEELDRMANACNVAAQAMASMGASAPGSPTADAPSTVNATAMKQREKLLAEMPKVRCVPQLSRATALIEIGSSVLIMHTCTCSRATNSI